MTEDKNQFIDARLLAGFRDFLPKQKKQRDWLIEQVRQVYVAFGFQPLETPVLEYADILTGKYGEEGNQNMYRFKDKGERDVAMRYDLTVPFARVIAQYPDLVMPFKRYQVAPVWRTDSPQAGRYREFYQMDADVAGSSSMLADAEVIRLIASIMEKLGVKNFMARISNRKILNGIIEWAGIDKANVKRVLVTVDKIDKIGADEVRKELLAPASIYVPNGKDQNGDTIMDEKKLPLISEASVEKVMEFIGISGTNEEILDQLKTIFVDNEIGSTGVKELGEVISYLDDLGVDKSKVRVDLSIARGLDYYTGTVYETTLLDLPGFGSVFSGGRFDELIGLFTGMNVPAVGASVGIDRLFTAMEKLNLLPDFGSSADVLVTAFPENPGDSLKVARVLREAGLNVEVYLGQKPNLKQQLAYANKLSIPVVVITFADKAAEDIYAVKKMDKTLETPVQVETIFEKLVETVKNI